MNRLSVFVICLLLFMINGAFSVDRAQDVPEQRVGSAGIHRHAPQNNGVGSVFTDYCPWNWTRTSQMRAVIVALSACLILQSYIVTQKEKSRCKHYIDSQDFLNYNHAHNTHLSPTSILQQGGANIHNNPILSLLDGAYEAGQEFQYALTNSTVNGSHLECHYSPTFDYRHSDQGCTEFSPHYRDISFDLTYNVSHFYSYYKNYGLYKRLSLWLIPMGLMFYFYAMA